MSSASHLEQLMNGIEVEWIPIKDLLVRTKGTKITARKMKEMHKVGAPLKIYAGGKTVAFVDYEDIPPADVNREPSIIVKSRGYIEFEYYDKPFSHKNEMWSYHSKKDHINIKYLFHFLRLNEFYFQSIAGRAKMPQISIPDTDGYQVPIPYPSNPKKSLEIQGEIVRILDTFTKLTAELTAELTARKKQYNYYRDQLLSFEDGEAEWKTLDDVCFSISAGGDVPKQCAKGQSQPTAEFPYPIFANATGEKALYGYTDKYKIDSDAVTISARGAKVGYHTVREAKFTPIIRLIVLVPDNELILTRYLNYVLDMTPIGGDKGGIPQLTVPTVKRISVPIPFANDPEKSLLEQNRLISILDKFDTLTTSTTEGLPREIELRQKQYEYYRDLLLRFPKPDEVEA